MHMQRDIDQQFRELHDAQVKAYQERVQRWKEQVVLGRERAQADEKEVRASLKKSGIDLDFLDRRAQKAQEQLKGDLEKIRPSLVNRLSTRAADFKQRALNTGRLDAVESLPGHVRSHIQLPVFATSLIATDQGDLAGVDGEQGSGWVFPTDPSQINIKRNSTGDGWGCFWAVAAPPPLTYSVYYYFIPNQTAQWELTAVTGFHGFYILKAHDSTFTCKSAEVHLEVNMDVYQYGWAGQQNFKLLNIENDNIDAVENYDFTRFTDITTGLRAGDPVLVRMQVTLDAFALGGGSYAEINFSDGAANYIEPLFLSAQVL